MGTYIENDCMSLVCNEIQAYYFQKGHLMGTEESIKQIVMSKALGSVDSWGPCKGKSRQELSKAIEESYEKCATKNF